MFNPFNIFKARENICDRYSFEFIDDLVQELSDDGFTFEVDWIALCKYKKNFIRLPYDTTIQRSLYCCRYSGHMLPMSPNAYLIWFKPNTDSVPGGINPPRFQRISEAFLKYKKETFDMYDIKCSILYNSGFRKSADFILY